jgi:hypothetical protein
MLYGYLHDCAKYTVNMRCDQARPGEITVPSSCSSPDINIEARDKPEGRFA